jgi:hypothetical protein
MMMARDESALAASPQQRRRQSRWRSTLKDSR